MASTTVFGSIADFEKGSIEIVSGDPVGSPGTELEFAL